MRITSPKCPCGGGYLVRDGSIVCETCGKPIRTEPVNEGGAETPDEGASAVKHGSFTDGRDGQTYKTVKMPDGKVFTHRFQRRKDARHYARSCDPWIGAIFPGIYDERIKVRDDVPSRDIIKANQY
jgi:hypothetical protein